MRINQTWLRILKNYCCDIEREQHDVIKRALFTLWKQQFNLHGEDTTTGRAAKRALDALLHETHIP